LSSLTDKLCRESPFPEPEDAWPALADDIFKGRPLADGAGLLGRAQDVLDPAEVDAVELARRSQDLDQGGGMDDGIAPGHCLVQAGPVGNVAGGELDPGREALP